jgi:hypothetical protein
MTDTERKAEFRWASIAGADPEPVEVIELDGRKGILTTGCADPFWLDDEAVGIVLHASAMGRPTPFESVDQRAKREAKYQAEKAAYNKAHPHHGWRGPR